jgi:hypothetical protein
MKSNQLRPSGALVPPSGKREERLHGKCGDWRTFLSYPAFLLKRKQDRCCYASYSLSLPPETLEIPTVLVQPAESS